MRFWASVALLGLTASACIPSVDTGPDGGGAIIVTKAGGVFARNGAFIDIPPDAVSEETEIFVTITDTGIPEIAGRKRISYGYKLTPSSLKLMSSIKMTIPYEEMRVPKGVDTATFDMRRLIGSETPVPLAGSRAIALAEYKAVEGTTEKLGLFWATSAAEPDVGTLTLSPKDQLLHVGDTLQYQAVVKSSTGVEIEVPVTWEALPPRAASIDAGFLTALAPGIVTVTAKAASQSDTVNAYVIGDPKGPTTFEHDNPFPTGNDLWGGTFLPLGLGSAFVGGNGTVLAQSSTGAFSRVFSAPGVTLKAIAGTSLSNGVAIGSASGQGVLVELTGGTAAPKVSTFTTVDPRSLWFDGTNGMAVGQGNDVLIRRNGTWVKEYSPSFEALLHVIGDSSGAFVTVGNRGSIYRYDPTTKTWNSLYQDQLAVLLSAGFVANPAGSEAWAVGAQKVWHFSAGAWVPTNFPATLTFGEVTAFSRLGARFAIGGKVNNQGAVAVFSPNPDPDAGTEVDDAGVVLAPGWILDRWRAPQVPRGIVTSASGGFVVGDVGAIYAYGPTGSGVEVSRGFYGDVSKVVTTDGGFVLAAVNECADPACTTKRGNVFVRNGPFDWAPLGAFPGAGAVTALTATSSSDVLASAGTSIYRFDGMNWATLPTNGGVSAQVNAIKYCGNTLFAAGGQGTNYRGNGTLLTQLTPLGGSDLYSLSCVDDGEIWVAGTGVVASRTVSSAYGAKSSMAVQPAAWRAVWTPARGEAFVFGDSRYGAYWNTKDFVMLDMPGGIYPDVVTDLWGSSIDNLYAVGVMQLPGPLGFALRFDGAQWRLVDSGSQRRVTSIHGSSPTDIWLGTLAGGIMRPVAPK